MLAVEMTVGDLLKDRRESLGLTQDALAEKSGVPVGSVRNYEQGHRLPSLGTAAKLGVVLGISLDEFGRCEGLQDERSRTRKKKRK